MQTHSSKEENSGLEDWSHACQPILEPILVNEKKEAETEQWIKKCDQYEVEKQNQDIKELFE